MFISEISYTGNILNVTKIEGSGDNEEPMCIRSDKLGNNIFFAGGFDGTLDFNSNMYTSNGGTSDAFAIKYGLQCITSVAPLSDNKTQIAVFPNPVINIVNVSWPATINVLYIEIFNMNGSKYPFDQLHLVSIS